MARTKPFHNVWRGDFDYLRLMAAEIEKSYTPGTTFRKESHQDVNRKYRELIESRPLFPLAILDHSDDFLNANFKELKRCYQVFSELLSNEGIHWDSQNNVISGNHPLLAQNYGHYVPEINAYVGEGEDNYHMMCEVFERGVYFEM